MSHHLSPELRGRHFDRVQIYCWFLIADEKTSNIFKTFLIPPGERFHNNAGLSGPEKRSSRVTHMKNYNFSFRQVVNQ